MLQKTINFLFILTLAHPMFLHAQEDYSAHECILVALTVNNLEQSKQQAASGLIDIDNHEISEKPEAVEAFKQDQMTKKITIAQADLKILALQNLYYQKGCGEDIVISEMVLLQKSASSFKFSGNAADQCIVSKLRGSSSYLNMHSEKVEEPGTYYQSSSRSATTAIETSTSCYELFRDIYNEIENILNA